MGMAENGREALTILQELQGEGLCNDPIIMLLDMRMPNMDGQTCASHVRSLHREGKLRRVPYVVCCSAGVEQVSFGGADGGDFTFDLTMPKPFSNKQVGLVLQNAEKWWATGAGIGVA